MHLQFGLAGAPISVHAVKLLAGSCQGAVHIEPALHNDSFRRREQRGEGVALGGEQEGSLHAGLHIARCLQAAAGPLTARAPAAQPS